MKPILYESNSTTFNDMGLGVLSDCISCTVTEERNGIYECVFEYPITGVHYAEIAEGRIVCVSHDEQKDLQPFVIYHITKAINGVCEINAHHISYKLSNVIVIPFEASNIGTALNGLATHSINSNPFTFWTDKTTSGNFATNSPASIRSLLGGSSGSILDVYGGEYEFDNLTVKLYQHRGYDNGVTIRYGKNLTDLVNESDTMNLYNAVVPFWSDGESTVVYGGIVTGDGSVPQIMAWTDENGLPMQDEQGSALTFNTYLSRVTTMDLTSEFEEPPTVAQLESRAATILNANMPWIPNVNIKVDFVALWQTEEYKGFAPLERVRLCDTVTVKYAELGVDATAKVIKVVWNALTERYDEIELGDAKTSFADTIMSDAGNLIDEKLKDTPSWSDMDLAIMNATNLITGGMGGHIVFLYDANQHPTDMLVMDTADVSTAVHVLRINVNGIGFSSNGINGPYTSAWTLNGVFNADFIVAGTMSAARIHGGTLSLGGQNNGDGVLAVYDASGNIIGLWNNAGIEINGGIIHTSDGSRTSSIESGFTRYYTGAYVNGRYTGDYIGSIGTGSYDQYGWDNLEMDMMYEADGIGWYASTNAANTQYEPIIDYLKEEEYLEPIVDEAESDGWIWIHKTMHITNGYALKASNIKECKLIDPTWKMDGTNYNGVTKTTAQFVLPMDFTSSGTATGWWDAQLTFVHGILVAATLP